MMTSGYFTIHCNYYSVKHAESRQFIYLLSLIMNIIYIKIIFGDAGCQIIVWGGTDVKSLKVFKSLKIFKVFKSLKVKFFKVFFRRKASPFIDSSGAKPPNFSQRQRHRPERPPPTTRGTGDSVPTEITMGTRETGDANQLSATQRTEYQALFPKSPPPPPPDTMSLLPAICR
jgi:hypothetical protein